MAIARLSVKVGKAGKAAPHAEYIDRDEEKKKKKTAKKKKKSGGDESIYTGYSRSQVSLKIIVRATLGVKDKD